MPDAATPRPRFLGTRDTKENLTTNWGNHLLNDNGDIVCKRTNKVVGSIRGSRDAN